LAHFKVEGLIVGYGARVLIHNLSFHIPSPSFLAILGHNGSGKSSFFKAISKLIPYEGNMWIQDKNLKHVRNPAAEGLMAVLDQKNTVTFSVSVRELIVMGLYRHKKFYQSYNAHDYDQVDRLLQELEISHLADQDFSILSGGEQQMVWLAQLMIQDASLLLLDEPTQQLDIHNKKKVFDLMASWVNTYHKTVICITHDIHNLPGMPGYLINISAPEPRIEPISEASVKHHIHLLEQKPPQPANLQV
jgi:iron complex transport system ATP-binding protein